MRMRARGMEMASKDCVKVAVRVRPFNKVSYFFGSFWPGDRIETDFAYASSWFCRGNGMQAVVVLSR